MQITLIHLIFHIIVANNMQNTNSYHSNMKALQNVVLHIYHLKQAKILQFLFFIQIPRKGNLLLQLYTMYQHFIL